MWVNKKGGGHIAGVVYRGSRGRGCRGWVGGKGEGRANIKPNVYRYTYSTLKYSPPFL